MFRQHGPIPDFKATCFVAFTAEFSNQKMAITNSFGCALPVPQLLYGILKHACADCSTDRFRKPALDGWVYDALIVPVLRSAAPRTRVKAALTFEWRCGCCLLGEAEVTEVLRCILPLAL